jgi:hypothetical protein
MTMTTIPSAAQTNSADLLPEPGPTRGPRKTPFYCALWVQVLVAMALAIVVGSLNPAPAVAMKPLGDAFIRAIYRALGGAGLERLGCSNADYFLHRRDGNAPLAKA